MKDRSGQAEKPKTPIELLDFPAYKLGDGMEGLKPPLPSPSLARMLAGRPERTENHYWPFRPFRPLGRAVA